MLVEFNLFFTLFSPTRCIYKGGEVKVGITREKDRVSLECIDCPQKKAGKRYQNVMHITLTRKVK